MKHLKLYESFNSSDYYELIPRSEHHRLRQQVRLDFDPHENKYLDEIAKSKGYVYSITNHKIGDVSKKIYRFIKNDNITINNNKALYKYDDEWYIVVSYGSGIIMDEKYYKCDGFDGLIKCLKEIL
jgi:negative regulator of genetic competence, sporulation and motility